MKQISIITVGFAVSLAIAPALAEDFTAGKTPAQLFRSDCGECHRSPHGLVRDRDVGALSAFLREHYTTKPETAAALAAYVSGFASTGPAARRGPAQPGRERTRSRSEGDAPATAAVVVPRDPKPADDPAVRRRRTTSLQAEGEKRRPRDDGDVPRPPRGVGTASPTTASPGPNAPTRVSEPQETDGPISRLRSYLSSGLNSESATAQAGRTGSPKVRKRRNNTDDTQAGAKAAGDAPAAPDAPAVAPAAEPPLADAPPEATAGEQQ